MSSPPNRLARYLTTSALGQLEDPVDTIDAAVFSGASFHNWEAIAELEHYMARWQRELARAKEVMRADPEYYGKEPE